MRESRTQDALDKLDGPTSHEGPDRDIIDRRSYAPHSKHFPTQIPQSGRETQRKAADTSSLFAIWPASICRITGNCHSPALTGHHKEYGPFRDFVRAALTPFGDVSGCEADIKKALNVAREQEKNRILSKFDRFETFHWMK